MTQDVAGLESSTSTVLRYIISAEVTAGSPAAGVRFIIDSVVHVEGADFDRGQVAAVRDAVFQARLLPSGRVTELDEETTNEPLMNRIHTSLSQFFPIIPADGLQPGATWEDTTSSVRRTGGTQIQIDAIIESHAGDWENVEDHATLTITWRANYTLAGEGEQLGRHFTIQGTGVTSGQSRVSREGMFLGTISSDSSHAEVLVQDLGYAIPIVQSGTDTLALIR